MENYIQKQFTTDEITLAIKELGFDKECLAGYTNNKKFYLKPDYFIDIQTPLWQQVIDWLREEYNLHIWISCTPYLNSYSIKYNFNAKIVNENILYSKYEKAREQAILKCIEIIKNKL